MGIKHTKNNNIADWTEGELQHQISNGNFPSDTTLNDIVLPSDWNDDHQITSDVDLGDFGIEGGNASFKSLNIHGVSGNGHIHLKHQASDPLSSASSSTIFADSNGNIAWKNDGVAKITLDTNDVTTARTYTFQDKSYTVADNADLAAKQDALISGTNIKTINGSSLLGSGDLTVSGSSVVARGATQQDIINTTTETSILLYTIPANSMGTDKILKVSLGGYFYNNSASTANATFRLRVKLGGTTLYNDITGVLAISTNLAPVFIDLKLIELNATNAQRVSGFVEVGLNNAATTGAGDLGSDETLATTPIRATGTKDMTSNQNLDVTIELGKADANLQFTRDYYLVELV